MKESGLIYTGIVKIGKNSPHKNIIGNLRKFENVWASKTSLTDTAIKSPRKVDAIPIIIIAGITSNQTIPDRSTKKAAIMIGTKAFAIPNKIAPDVFASISNSRDTGASSNLSNDLCLLSKVIVTASIDVVPNRIEIVITPGSSAVTLSMPLPDLMKNIPVQARGKIIPQLILGGFR